MFYFLRAYHDVVDYFSKFRKSIPACVAEQNMFQDIHTLKNQHKRFLPAPLSSLFCQVLHDVWKNVVYQQIEWILSTNPNFDSDNEPFWICIEVIYIPYITIECNIHLIFAFEWFNCQCCYFIFLFHSSSERDIWLSILYLTFPDNDVLITHFVVESMYETQSFHIWQCILNQASFPMPPLSHFVPTFNWLGMCILFEAWTTLLTINIIHLAKDNCTCDW